MGQYKANPAAVYDLVRETEVHRGMSALCHSGLSAA